MELSERARELRNAYQQKWRRKNANKMKQYAANYWEKKAASYSMANEAMELSQAGFTQRQIAVQLNISVGTVNKILNGA